MSPASPSRQADKDVTLPVKDKVWFYEGASPSLTSRTIHFKYGSTERPQATCPPAVVAEPRSLKGTGGSPTGWARVLSPDASTVLPD
jgi:hypothetical protein